MESRWRQIQHSIVTSQLWKSVFRVGVPNTNRKRVLAMLGNVVLHLHPVKTRKSGVKMRYTWCAGGITFFLFLVLTFTGLLLMFYYRPTVEYAFVDILDLREQVPFGIMREVHRWGAHAMVISVWIHMFRVFMTGSYKPPREFNWVIGVILLVLTLLLSFTGYLLPWDQLAIWAITVGSNMASATPLIGIEGPGTALLKIGDIPLVTSTNDARFGLLGGRFVGAGALLRFYVLHCVGIPLIAAFLMAVHFWRVRKDGGISGPCDEARHPLIQILKNVINFLSAPEYLVSAMLVGLLIGIRWKWLWSKQGGLALLVLIAGGIGLSYLDPNFNKVATLPDNVPIVGMIFLVGFFFWFALNQAYENDRRTAAGLPTIEGQDSAQKVFSWPDLVYVELICLVVVMAVMIVWSIVLKAPLEEPANPTDSPNPAKAPWYFLGLQEMLVYFDPWLAGVVLPSLIIVGLMAIPYIDTNPKGNGYFTFRERKSEITMFLLGFIVLWCTLIVLGTFLRGPNWNFFGPYEFWDVNKLVPLNNINLSEIIWIRMLKRQMPHFWLWREIFGLAICGFYLAALPLLLSKTLLRRFFEKMGPARYLLGVSLALMMFALPIKMYLRWIFNLKYIVNIPEFAFNI